jgi:hypothetical protein
MDMRNMQTAAERTDKGVQSLAALMNYWLATSSHDKLAAILRWGYGEPTGLDGGSLSRIRNAKQGRGAGIKHLDAIAEANRAIWMWKQDPAAAIRAFGPHSSFGVKAEWLDEICWLPAPEPNEDQPLDLGDLAMLLVGRLELPYLGAQLLSPFKLSRMTERFAQLLEDEASDRGWGPRETIQRFQAAYPSTDPGRQNRLKELLMGGDIQGTELELELAAFAEMLRSIRGIDSFTPADLQQELLSVRRPLS